jgi:hypothetical protein
MRRVRDYPRYRWRIGTVQGAVATWRLLGNYFRVHQVATAPCTVPFSEVHQVATAPCTVPFSEFASAITRQSFIFPVASVAIVASAVHAPLIPALKAQA